MCVCTKVKAEELHATSFTCKYEKFPFQTQRRVSNLTHVCVPRGPEFPENLKSVISWKIQGTLGCWDGTAERAWILGETWVPAWHHTPPDELEQTS